MAQEHNQEIVCLKEAYRKDKAVRYMGTLIFGGIIIILLLLLSGYIIASKPKPQFFVTDEREEIFASRSLTDPIYNEAQIRDWTAQRMFRLFSMNFINYQTRVKQNASLFTPSGYQAYVSVLRTTDLPTIVNGSFVAKASLCDIITIDQKATGVFNIDHVDTYVWTLTVPLYLQYQNQDKYNVVARAVVRVQRVSELDYLGGLAINDLQIYDRTNTESKAASNLPVCNS
ncbi:MAG: DotI/IcmL/TraM family protein [Gammaproteobacteria bacterium]|nr:DotI/IcmL/TraM family protein [Gammaproteobacteria bacterium]